MGLVWGQLQCCKVDTWVMLGAATQVSLEDVDFIPFASDTFLFLDYKNMQMCALQHIVYVIIRLLSPFILKSGFLVGESFQLVVGSDLL